MIKSMTGFGRGTAMVDGREMTVELRSVNHKYLDLNFRIPRAIGFVEEALRGVMAENLSRGHVDITVSYANKRADSVNVSIDRALAAQYVQAARQAAEDFSIPFDMTASALFRCPNVVNIEESEEDQECVIALAREAAQLAAEALVEMRSREGARLFADFEERISTIEELYNKAFTRAPFVITEYREKLIERVNSALSGINIDQDRIAAEIVLYTDKVGIDEELTRIKSHVKEFRAVLKEDEAVGRRMDFIIQELNREFNTIGSKANDAELAQCVILAKTELEKIREQVQNIE